MKCNPDVVIKPNQTHGLMAISGWEQLEARALLHQLGWRWDAQHHAMALPSTAGLEEAAAYALVLLRDHGFCVVDQTHAPRE